jgi:NAD-reducing hydrogenase small subunit
MCDHGRAACDAQRDHAEAYIGGPYTQNKTQIIPNDPALPLLLDRVYPCSEVVEIDYQIPGCAPTGDVIFEALSGLLSGKFQGFEREHIRFD